MSIVAITVEYVLAGLLILCIFVAPFVDEALLVDSEALLFVAIGAAYLLGVVADRIAEHVLEPIGRYGTLRKAGVLESDAAISNDPLPLDQLTLEIRKEGEGLLAWHDQLRGRLRVTRNLFVYGHWAIVAIGLCLGSSSVDAWTLPIVASVAIGLQALSASAIEVPRTDEFKQKMENKGVGQANAFREDLAAQNKAIWWRWGAIGPLVGGGILCWQLSGEPSLMLGLWWLSSILWFASAHAWWRVHNTFLGFMKDYARSRGNTAA